MNEPLVSVVIAVKNGEAFLGEAIESARAQSWPATEIIVVDGHSTDRSHDIARSFPEVRVLLQKTTGFAGAWNEGIRACSGPYVAILDSDDLWEPAKLALQVAALEANPRCGFALGHTRFLLMDGAAVPPGFARVDLDRDHAAPFPSVLLARRSLFDEVGLFEENWSVSADVEWFRRIYDHGVPGVMVPQVLMRRRIHGANLSYGHSGAADFNRELLSILRTSLNRRRKASASEQGP
jgi:glycosyltransferase involved in cell wall biosynthesis